MNNFNDIDYKEIVRIVVSEIDPEKIILFGSRGRGDHKPDADLDLLVIDNKQFSKDRGRLFLRTKLRRALSGINVPKDILLYNSDEVEHWKNYHNHILFTCVSEGKLLYAKS
jgi:predicted nucleotidyltransferase